jgi:ELWxxDGT repeat protein
MAAWFNANTNLGGFQLYKLGSDDSVTQWTALAGTPPFPNVEQGLDPQDLTFFNNAVWFNGQTPLSGQQLFKLGNDGSVTKWTEIGTAINSPAAIGVEPQDLTVFNGALWFNGQAPFSGQQLYKLGNDGSVTKWTDISFVVDGHFAALEPQNMTVFNNALWFNGDTPTSGRQLWKLGNDGSVTKWTDIAFGTAAGVTSLDPQELTIFNNALWFSGLTLDGDQLFKLGSDGSVTKWTANPGGGGGLFPQNLTVFNDALWFNGSTPTHGQQLFKLGADGSVTQWTDIGLDLHPNGMVAFNNALWFLGFDGAGLNGGGPGQLYKLGNDGSVTKWTANPGSGGSGLDPLDLTVFNGALWFAGETLAHGEQLFKLGADGSVTQWTDISTFRSSLSPVPISTAAGDPDSTPLSVANNALWFQAHSPTSGTELYRLGADGSFVLWKDINPGLPDSSPHDWALL